MVQEDLHLFFDGRLREDRAVFEEGVDLFEDPGVARGASADHDGGRTGLLEHGLCGGAVPYIAVGYDGDGHRVHNGFDGAAVDGRRIHLVLRPAVYREGCDARVFEAFREVHTDEVVRVPAGAHLDGDRLVDRLHDRSGDGHRKVRVSQQGRAGVVAGDLRRGAAHVEVDGLTGKLRFDAFCRFRKDGRVIPEELDGAGVFEVRQP